MNETDLLGLWSRARMHVIVSQFAPVFLLTVTVVLLTIKGETAGPIAVRIASAGVLLASGILGAIVQYTAAGEAQAIVADLSRVEHASQVSLRIIQSAWWTPIVKFVTPAIFVVIYLALLWALFIPA